MFICAVTGKPSLPREPMIKVVTARTAVTYKNLIEHEDERGRMSTVEKVSKGEETVTEIGVTKEGYDLLMSQRLSNPSEALFRVRPQFSPSHR